MSVARRPGATDIPPAAPAAGVPGVDACAATRGGGGRPVRRVRLLPGRARVVRGAQLRGRHRVRRRAARTIDRRKLTSPHPDRHVPLPAAHSFHPPCASSSL
eukprot:878020-Prymnesium_polylepis.1